jgi:hypothetical protein
MDRSLSPEDVERLTVKSKVLSLKMRSDANFGDRVVLGLLNDGIKKRSLPQEHVPRIHDLLQKFGVG